MVENLCGGRVAGDKDRSKMLKNEVVEELIHDGLEARRFGRKTFLQLDVFCETSYQRNIISKTLEAGRELSRTGSKHDRIEARWENLKLDEKSKFDIMELIRTGAENYSGLITDQKLTGRTEIRPMDREARGGSLHVIRTCCQPSNKLSVYRSSRCCRAWKQYMQPDRWKHKPDIWEEWWHPACVLAILKDMWRTRCRRACVRSHAERHTGCHQPEADWLPSLINTPRPQLISSHPDLSKTMPREGSVQMNSSRPVISFDDQVEVLLRVSSVQRVKISRSSEARYSAGKS
ncbi:hypothetical protein F2Q69_00058867 [Brassica cretica]|uniref:Uncharacterized protein n=1 Tax=Brassica cretica TaxID=69181 RepID=A0A8S9RNA8_BRACR|nr:hypothetical protein F2Q69_00058867 [Brassica cretica]